MRHRHLFVFQAVSRDDFLSAMHSLCGDATFSEAFKRTGRHVSLTIATPASAVGSASLLNHITAPDVLVRSAVQASCALPGVMRPSALLSKGRDGEIAPHESAGLTFRDGSFQNDIPIAALASQFNSSQFVVSQVNPHITPFLDDRTQPCSPLYRLQRFLINDVLSRLQYYDRKGGYLPTELANLVAQHYVGRPTDVNIFPAPTLGDLTWRVFSQPDEAGTARFIRGGQAMAWPHLKRLTLQTQLERTMRKCATHLEQRQAAAAQEARRSKGEPGETSPPRSPDRL